MWTKLPNKLGPSGPRIPTLRWWMPDPGWGKWWLLRARKRFRRRFRCWAKRWKMGLLMVNTNWACLKIVISPSTLGTYSAYKYSISCLNVCVYIYIYIWVSRDFNWDMLWDIYPKTLWLVCLKTRKLRPINFKFDGTYVNSWISRYLIFRQTAFFGIKVAGIHLKTFQVFEGSQDMQGGHLGAGFLVNLGLHQGISSIYIYSL